MYHRRTGHIPGRDHATADGPASGRAIVLFGLFFLMTGCLLFLQACDTVEATKERENMAMTKTESVLYLQRPPIDLAAPAETETATFALG